MSSKNDYKTDYAELDIINGMFSLVLSVILLIVGILMNVFSLYISTKVQVSINFICVGGVISSLVGAGVLFFTTPKNS